MPYDWTDNPTLPGTDVDVTKLNDNLMHLKYDNSSGAIGLTNYIAEGRKFTTGADLNLTISAGRESISESKVERVENIIELHASRAQLIYDTKAGATGILDAAFPAADAGTVGRWIIDGGATIASTVGSNSLTKSGTITQVTGWASDNAGQFDGATGFYTAANVTGIPTSGSFGFEVLYTHKATGAQQIILYNGINNGYMFAFGTLANNNIFVSGQFTDTGFTLEDGEIYYISVGYTGTNYVVYVNGRLVADIALAMSYTAGALVFGKSVNNNFYCAGTLHFAAIRNALRTPAQIAAISNALLLPCRYDVSILSNQNVCTLSEGISGGDIGGYSKDSLFNGSTSDAWASAQQANSVSGNAYIGQKNLPSIVQKVKLYTNSGTANNAYSVKLQYSNNQGSDWDDIQTSALATTANIWVEVIVAEYPGNQNHWFRVLANNNFGISQSWIVNELQFYCKAVLFISDIRAILPADSIALGRVRTDATHPIEADDSSWMVRREGLPGMTNYNGKVFLGWQYFSGAAALDWDNPFGTRKARARFTFADDATGRNESPIVDIYSGGSNYGHMPAYMQNGKIRATILGGGLNDYTGTWRTSGYVGCYAEVIE